MNYEETLAAMEKAERRGFGDGQAGKYRRECPRPQDLYAGAGEGFAAAWKAAWQRGYDRGRAAASGRGTVVALPRSRKRR